MSAERRAPTEPALWLVAPALLAYTTVVLYPSAVGAIAAFTDWNGLDGGRHYVGLENFRTLLADDVAQAALRNTLLVTAFIVVAQNVLALALALALQRAVHARGALRVVFLVPAVISPLVIAFLWQYLLGPGPDEGMNRMLGVLGLGSLRQDWLGDPGLALWSIGLMSVWQHVGLATVVFVAGLEAIPRDLLQAAELDGAGLLRRLRHIVLPLLAPALTINLILSTVAALKLFEPVFAITRGGPGHATETLSTLIYDQAFVYGRFGYATAIALVLTVLVSAATIAQLHVLRRRGRVA